MREGMKAESQRRPAGSALAHAERCCAGRCIRARSHAPRSPRGQECQERKLRKTLDAPGFLATMAPIFFRRERDEFACRRRFASALLSCLLLAGCCPPPPTYYTGPTDPMAKVVADINA